MPSPVFINTLVVTSVPISAIVELAPWTPHKDTDNIPELTIGESVSDTSRQTRVVSNASRKMLQNKLLQYHKELPNQVDVDSMVTCPNVLLEFNILSHQSNCMKLPFDFQLEGCV